MARRPLGLLMLSALGLCVLTAPAHGQSLAWWDFTPRLASPTDALVPRDDVFEPPPPLPVPVSISLGRWLDADSSVGFDVTRLRPDLGLSRTSPGIEPTAGTAY